MRGGGVTLRYDGLNETQVKAARSLGENTLGGEKKSSVAGLFFSQFKDLMILILAAATVISALMGETAEAITIIAIVLLNAVMGFLQEYRTEKTLSALRAMTAPKARLIRSGAETELPASQVVCGDIALLNAGDRIPADGELLEAQQLSADESLLTGESENVVKTVGEKVYMGTMISGGNGVMRVTAVGMKTEMGSIASMIQQTENEKTPLQQKLQQLGKLVAVSCLVICTCVSLIGLLQGETLLETLLSGISLAVAAIPEGMPAIVTIVLALSVGRILKKGAIIRRLPAVETLGCAGVICSDKTGTITQNRMTLSSVFCDGKIIETDHFPLKGVAAAERLRRCAVLCSDARMEKEAGQLRIRGSATEAALLSAAANDAECTERLRREFTRCAEIPFDPIRKRMAVTVQYIDGAKLYLCKGAPDILLPLCERIACGGSNKPMTAADRRVAAEAVRTMGQQGFRVLAFAENDNAGAGENGMIFLGLAGLQDPPKPQVEGAVRRCRRAGMKPVMITGDHAQTARAIAEKVGIWQNGDQVVTGEELDTMTEEDLAQRCMKISVFARVTPQHKLRIVRAYQKCGQVAAMTGDGVILLNAAKKRQRRLPFFAAWITNGILDDRTAVPFSFRRHVL